MMQLGVLTKSAKEDSQCRVNGSEVGYWVVGGALKSSEAAALSGHWARHFLADFLGSAAFAGFSSGSGAKGSRRRVLS
jgi:hypothetical protein